jgi:hypothetical protein
MTGAGDGLGSRRPGLWRRVFAVGHLKIEGTWS